MSSGSSSRTSTGMARHIVQSSNQSPPARARACANAACPNDTPPSLAGAARGRRRIEPARAQRRDEPFGQHAVHQAAAAERDPRECRARAPPSPIHSASAAIRVPWNSLGRLAAAQAGRRACDRISGARSSRPSAMLQPPGDDARRRDQRLELHRRLAFVALDEADAGERGRGVEQAPEARRSRRSARRARSASASRAASGAPGKTRAASSSRPSRASIATPMRHGSRAAVSPPGSASGSSEPTRAQRAPSSAISSPPQGAPSVP